MARLRFFIGLALALALAPRGASAEPSTKVSGPVVRLGELVADAPAELGELELFKAPPPGASRLVTREELSALLEERGADVKRVRLPRTVRVETLGERWTPAELGARAEAVLRDSLPEGVTLARVKAPQGALLPVGTIVERVRPRIPKRAGRHELTAMAELVRDGEVVHRAPVSVTLEVSEAALLPAVRRGERLTVFVEQGNTRVGAGALAMADAAVGDSILCKVASTGKVVKALVTSKDQARVLDP